MDNPTYLNANHTHELYMQQYSLSSKQRNNWRYT